MNDKYLYLISNPGKWFGEESEENYRVNEILKNLTKEEWNVGNLKNISKGMKGIIKVSKDARSLNSLEKHNVSKLESGIYATFKVIHFHENKNPKTVEIKVIDNFFAQNIQISKEKSKKILGLKFMQQGQGYIDKDIYDAVYETVGEIIKRRDIPK